MSPKHPSASPSVGDRATSRYALLFRIASGQLLGPDQPVALQLLDIEPALPALEGVVMELDDCAFPLLHRVEVTADAKTAFDGVSWALLVGSVPRKDGMERDDLLKINGSIFGLRGGARAAAASDVRILVVGNPCNTNCLIARENGRDIPEERWFAMTRLDQNRAKAQLAKKAGALVTDVRERRHLGQPLGDAVPGLRERDDRRQAGADVIGDDAWLRGEFITTIQQRGAAIIKARGQSSAASAANAAVDSVRSIWERDGRG